MGFRKKYWFFYWITNKEEIYGGNVSSLTTTLISISDMDNTRISTNARILMHIAVVDMQEQLRILWHPLIDIPKGKKK